MGRLDVQTYRDNYLKIVEQRIIAKKDKIDHFSTQNLHDALMSELNRADENTWEVEVPDDRERALKEAEDRMIDCMRRNVDLGVGKAY